ncbi:signal recognition particle-docking protein FtsY [Pontibacter sp. G13]|uniref:signal recognition particle-docking protein FtsY n=1 Tax=Pontibacter sp. G13 TaxID=3074898 RepID=UPI00288C0C0D|nr:signal recognition particle-docking protein FtsY [Pontibacter sp. G13]WNJ19497.1 signal recognition particle-docking protein FtsY [Pontibacter sp. G13]
MLNFFKKKENKDKLNKGLEKTKQGFFSKLSKAIVGKSKVDDEVLDDLEEVLIASDVGVKTTVKIIERIEKRAAEEKYSSTKELDFLLKDTIEQLVLENHPESRNYFEIPEVQHEGKKVPYVVMVVGVNGVGKTTTIGKLSHQLKNKGYKVLLGAADTFRAAAVDQLKLWSERVGVDFYSKGMNTDPGAVAYESVQAGVKSGADIVLVDTAGRLHNKKHLMAELSKIKRSMTKVIPGAPHEVLLVLDASTGQNAVNQAQAFTEATEVSSLALTKLDGTAKGGVVIGVSDLFKIPVKYIGVGEGTDDLQTFDAREFVDSMFNQPK